jgi:hypothetical protein
MKKEVLDVNSKPILVQNFLASNNKAVTSISIPSSLTPGMYYIRVIDEKKKNNMQIK